MTDLITQARATALAKSVPYGNTNKPHTVLNPDGLQQLCEAAIKDYIERFKQPFAEAYWIDQMCNTVHHLAQASPDWRNWPGTAAFARAMFPVVKAYAAQCAEAALRDGPTLAKPPEAAPAAPAGLPPIHSYVVEGWEGTKLLATSHSYDLDGARQTASAFAQRYPTVHTKPLHTSGAVTLWWQDKLADARHVVAGAST